ncbi:MAG: murein peptide amidase A [Planctomycetes bacterium]|nr:murein peptide amidase A [Planctomycetota bacterium]
MRIAIFTSLLGVVMMLGCRGPFSETNMQVLGDYSNISLPLSRYVAGTSFENRPIECIVLGDGEDVTFIMAAIHGNEVAGTPLCHKLISYLDKHRYLMTGKQVVVMPVANPDGVVSNQRHNARGVDLNRNFESANRQNNSTNGMAGLTEPESRVIKEVIRVYAPDRILALHEPLNCIDWDGPGEGLARRMGEFCDLPVNKLGSRPGSLGSYAGLALGIPIITVEFPRGSGQLEDEVLWVKYGTMLVTAVTYPDLPGLREGLGTRD